METYMQTLTRRSNQASPWPCDCQKSELYNRSSLSVYMIPSRMKFHVLVIPYDLQEQIEGENVYRLEDVPHDELEQPESSSRS